jgi:hypothetical protein
MPDMRILLTHIGRHLWFLDLFSSPSIVQSRFEPVICVELPSLYSLFTLLDSKTSFTASDQPLSCLLHDIYRVLANANDIYIPNYFEELRSGSSNEQQEVGRITKAVSFPQPADGVFESCYLAHVIWMHSSQNLSTGTSSMLQTLRDTLETTRLADWSLLPGALLWCLLVGVDGTYGNSMLYPWFVSQLHRLWLPLGSTQWRGLQISLSCFGWLLRRGRDDRSLH